MSSVVLPSLSPVSGRLARACVGCPVRAWLLTLGVVCSGGLLWAAALRDASLAPAGGAHVPWWAIGLVFFLAESYVVHVRFRRKAHTISLNEIALVTGLYVLQPHLLLLAQLVGGGAALAFRRRQRPLKLMLNLGQFSLTTGVAVVVFDQVWSGGDVFGPVGWAAALAAAVAASIGGIVFVAVTIGIGQREWLWRDWPETIAVSLLSTAATSCIALVLLEFGRTDLRAVVLVLLPGVVVAIALRGYVQQSRQREDLQFLYDSMKRTQGAAEFGLAIRQLLLAAQQFSGAEYGEILLLPAGGEPGLRSTLRADGEHLPPTDVVVVDDDERVLELMPEGGNVLALPARRPPGPLDDYLGARRLRDAMIATLREDGKPFGLLIVGDRAGGLDTFGEDSAKLLDTFAGHVSVLLENGRLERSLADVTELKDRLRHQAFHDPLTGLPNRAAFAEKAASVIGQPRDGDETTAVLFLDLDDFKSINDSKGHSAGDELLVQVAARVSACVRPDDFPVRLGGDEFGVLLGPITPEGAGITARRLVEAFDEPFVLSGWEARTHASIGIALAHSAASVDELLRNADIAMYAAKAAGKNQFAFYESTLHDSIRRQHEVAVELGDAVARGEIIPVFQPIVSLYSGQVAAFEALARWNRPGQGLVHPIEFVSVAEESGQLDLVGNSILHLACRAARQWQDADLDGVGIAVTVNLSPRQLLGDGLVDNVARTLVETRLEPRSLILEITESTMASNFEFAITRLEELRALGVRLALDDFGTGHSSLERLDLLPLDVLKIAKPFVDRLLESTAARRPLVGAFVTLCENLSLDCIAEGIEHPTQVSKLLNAGCRLGQGYHFSKPMLKADVADYLQTRRAPQEIVRVRPAWLRDDVTTTSGVRLGR
jgi:diguanylate cyclase (GGDEF)-like protein